MSVSSVLLGAVLLLLPAEAQAAQSVLWGGGRGRGGWGSRFWSKTTRECGPCWGRGFGMVGLLLASLHSEPGLGSLRHIQPGCLGQSFWFDAEHQPYEQKALLRAAHEK